MSVIRPRSDKADLFGRTAVSVVRCTFLNSENDTEGESHNFMKIVMHLSNFCVHQFLLYPSFQRIGKQFFIIGPLKGLLRLCKEKIGTVKKLEKKIHHQVILSGTFFFRVVSCLLSLVL